MSSFKCHWNTSINHINVIVYRLLKKKYSGLVLCQLYVIYIVGFMEGISIRHYISLIEMFVITPRSEV